MWDPRENALGFTEEEDKIWMAGRGDWQKQQVAVQMRDERRQRERAEQLKQQWDNSEEGRLFQKLSDSFAECKRLLTRNPELAPKAEQLGDKNFSVYEKLRENLERANRAPRCSYMKTNGELCKAPKIKGQERCCMHLAMKKTENEDFELPPLDDPNAVQVAITRGARGVMDGTLDEKRAMKLAYFLQLAVTNVGRVKFEPEDEN